VKYALLLITMLTMFQPIHAFASGCIDGNTCLVSAESYTGPVILFCVKAPPLSDPVGKLARSELNKQYHSTVHVLMDSKANGVPIAEFIREGGWNLGLELVRAGLARMDRSYCKEIEYILAENDAKDDKFGIWGDGSQ
jgi:endonuclease YncB( thermonuclease family)